MSVGAGVLLMPDDKIARHRIASAKYKARKALAAGRVPGVVGRPRGSTHTPEARAAIREAALRRWAEIKRGRE